jgi:hypothetical protein
MTGPAGLESEFSKTANGLPQTDFAQYLQETFDVDTAREVLKIFEQIELPAPERTIEFISGREGGLVPLNDYGVSIRIASPSDRINDHPFVLRPLASLKAGKAVFEICPATSSSDDWMESRYLQERLRSEGVNFWDEGPGNTGRIPVKTRRFPDGIIAVTNPAAVNKMTAGIKQALTPEEIEEAAEAEEAEQELYGPLCQSFVEAWDGRQGMQRFWDLCRSYTLEGKLAGELLPQTDFVHYLRFNPQCEFSERTVREVLKTFQQLGLPAPEKNEEFLWAAEGGLVFLDRYGMVIRLEKKNLGRINSDPFVLQPVASIDAGDVVVEICPACNFADNPAVVAELVERLLNNGIKFHDASIRNVGYLPIKSAVFPKGVPMVIDRPAVHRLSENIEPVRQLLTYRLAKKEVEKIYIPLRRGFNKCWPEAQNMKQFWNLCQSYVKKEKLVTGWNKEGANKVEYESAGEAAASAKAYEARLKAVIDNPLNSTVQAVPRLPRRSV